MFCSLACAPSHSLRRAAVIALLSLSFAGVNAAAATHGPQNDKALKNALRNDLQDYLHARSAIEHISTLSLTVSFRSDHDDIDVAAGTTAYQGGDPVTPSNLFQTGSNTKAFTSALLLKLEAEGVLSINDKLGKWLPQYPAWKDVTIRQLLNMTSGIPSYDNTQAWEGDYSNDPYTRPTPEQLVAYVYPEIKTPGAEFEYSNTGYILAQMIIDKASRWHSYQAELDHLIKDTHLQDTFYEPYFYPRAVTSRLVSGYYVNTDDTGLEKLLGTETSGYSLGWAQAAGGMISTPHDLTKWVRALFDGDVLPPEQRRELMSLVSVKTGQPIEKTSDSDSAGFGLGVFQITDKSLGRFWGYQGSTIGYRATYAYFPKTGLILCVFTNSQTSHEKNQINSVLFPTLYSTLRAFGRD